MIASCNNDGFPHVHFLLTLLMKRQPLSNLDYACIVHRKTNSEGLRHRCQVLQLVVATTRSEFQSTLMLPDIPEKHVDTFGSINLHSIRLETELNTPRGK